MKCRLKGGIMSYRLARIIRLFLMVIIIILVVTIVTVIRRYGAHEIVVEIVQTVQRALSIINTPHKLHNASSIGHLTWRCFLVEKKPSTLCHKLIINMPLDGRLGNFMFTYAATVGISHIYGTTPFITQNNPLLTYFHVSAGMFSDKSEARKIKNKFIEQAAHKHDRRIRELKIQEDIYLEGYFQSYKYFNNPSVYLLLKQLFTFKEAITMDARGVILSAVNAHARSQSCDVEFNGTHYSMLQYQGHRKRMVLHAIGVHIRRGDMVIPDSIQRGYKPAPEEYIFRAMDYFKRKYEDIIFIICTDDKKWVKQTLIFTNYTTQEIGTEDLDNIKHHFNITHQNSSTNTSISYTRKTKQAPPRKNSEQRSTITLSEGHSPEVDLAILSMCNHVIMTVGSYGWWGAWLSGGEVVYYKDYPVPNSLMSNVFSKEDYYPPDWIGMA